MRVLLAIDDSASSEAAMQAVIKQFRPQETEVRVLHVVEWPKGLPTLLAFAEGPAAASEPYRRRSPAPPSGKVQSQQGDAGGRRSRRDSRLCRRVAT
jgi:hypothetical protein